jgi:hypothetical protein
MTSIGRSERDPSSDGVLATVHKFSHSGENTMNRQFKWLLVPAVLFAALLFASPKSAEARRYVVRSYYAPTPHVTYVYRYRRPVYYAPVPAVVPQSPVVVYGQTVPVPVVIYSW